MLEVTRLMQELGGGCNVLADCWIDKPCKGYVYSCSCMYSYVEGIETSKRLHGAVWGTGTAPCTWYRRKQEPGRNDITNCWSSCEITRVRHAQHLFCRTIRWESMLPLSGGYPKPFHLRGLAGSVSWYMHAGWTNLERSA